MASGHLGIKKTLQRLRTCSYWVGMRRDVQEWCRVCDICTAKKGLPQTPQAPLQVVSVGTSSGGYRGTLSCVILWEPLYHRSHGHYQGCGVGVDLGVGVGRSRRFRPESESESTKYGRLRLRLRDSDSATPTPQLRLRDSDSATQTPAHSFA